MSIFVNRNKVLTKAELEKELNKLSELDSYDSTQKFLALKEHIKFAFQVQLITDLEQEYYLERLQLQLKYHDFQDLDNKHTEKKIINADNDGITLTQWKSEINKKKEDDKKIQLQSSTSENEIGERRRL